MITVVCHRVWSAARPVVRYVRHHVGHFGAHVVAHPFIPIASIVCVAVPGALWAVLPPTALPLPFIPPPWVDVAPAQPAGMIPPAPDYTPGQLYFPPRPDIDQLAAFPPVARDRQPSAPFAPADTRSLSIIVLPPSAFLPPTPQPIAEPSSAVAMGLGVLAVMLLRRRRTR